VGDKENIIRAFREKFSSVELIKSHIGRIKKFNKKYRRKLKELFTGITSSD